MFFFISQYCLQPGERPDPISSGENERKGTRNALHSTVYHILSVVQISPCFIAKETFARYQSSPVRDPFTINRNRPVIVSRKIGSCPPKKRFFNSDFSLMIWYICSIIRLDTCHVCSAIIVGLVVVVRRVYSHGARIMFFSPGISRDDHGLSSERREVALIQCVLLLCFQLRL